MFAVFACTTGCIYKAGRRESLMQLIFPFLMIVTCLQVLFLRVGPAEMVIKNGNV